MINNASHAIQQLKTWKIEVDFNDSLGYPVPFEFEFATNSSMSQEEAIEIGLARGKELTRKPVSFGYIKELSADTEYKVMYTVGKNDHREFIIKAPNKATALHMAITLIENQSLQITGRVTCVNNS